MDGWIDHNFNFELHFAFFAVWPRQHHHRPQTALQHYGCERRLNDCFCLCVGVSSVCVWGCCATLSIPWSYGTIDIMCFDHRAQQSSSAVFSLVVCDDVTTLTSIHLYERYHTGRPCCCCCCSVSHHRCHVSAPSLHPSLPPSCSYMGVCGVLGVVRWFVMLWLMY